MDIDDKTKIPLFAIIVAIPFLIAGIIWMATVDSKATAAQDEIRGARAVLWDIRERVIRIEEHQKQGEK